MPNYRKKPLAHFEHGTRIYALNRHRTRGAVQFTLTVDTR
jgi:hypothetical protein